MIKKRYSFTLIAVFCFFYGAAVGRYRIFPYHEIKEIKHAIISGASATARQVDPEYSDIYEKQEISCEAIDMTNAMVALTFGQSNSANYGETRYSPVNHVYNFYEGKCFKAADPLLGATGDKGSVWTRLGDELINSGQYRSVILVSIGFGGSSVADWKPGGALFQRIVDVKHHLDEQNMRLTHLLWHQGEAEKRIATKKDDYKTMLTDMVYGIRSLGIDAPLYLAIATRCKGPINVKIHQAQLELVRERDDILMGANTDTLSDMDDRYDFCHFSDAGLRKHAFLWLQALRNKQS